MSLSVLIEMMLQKIYHELTILAELLPRKTDIERYMGIYNFSPCSSSTTKTGSSSVTF